MSIQSFSIDHKYPVHWTENIFALENRTLLDCLPQEKKRVAVIIDDGVTAAFPQLEQDILAYGQHHKESLTLHEEILTIPGGEACKESFTSLENITRYLIDAKICRHSFVLIIGGGAVLDAASFACTVFHRGVAHIRIPTTVLAQDDSAVGVKNAINFLGLKNLLGTFQPAHAVINDFNLLSSLPKREVLAGVAEALKVALIKDVEFFNYLEANIENLLEKEVLQKTIKRSAELHMDHITGQGDPFEKGSSRPLDFGHWCAHRLETISQHQIRHGEAVAIGICLDIENSVEFNLLSRSDADRILSVFKRGGFMTFSPLLLERNASGELEIHRGLQEFREHLGGELTLPMLTEAGCMTEVHQMPEEILEASLKRLQKFSCA